MSRRLFPAVMLPLLTGCVVTETRTIVVAVPKDTKTVEVYAVFEGISVMAATEYWEADDDRARVLAARHLSHFSANHILFLIGDLMLVSLDRERVEFEPVDDEGRAREVAWTKALGGITYGRLRYFTEPARARSLCADRRMTFNDRKMLEKVLNAGTSEALCGTWDNPREAFSGLREADKFFSDPQYEKVLKAHGTALFSEPVRGLIGITKQFDAESIKLVEAAAHKDGEPYRWFRLEPDGIRLVLPATSATAKRIAEGVDTNRVLKQAQSFVRPVGIEACPEGIAVVLGAKGEPVRFTYQTPAPHRPGLEKRLIAAAGNPTPRVVDGKQMTGAELVRRFVADPTRPPD